MSIARASGGVDGIEEYVIKELAVDKLVLFLDVAGNSPQGVALRLTEEIVFKR